jgi:dTDP-4-amino-4,6-dideoxygalactose transaminase
VTAGLRFLPGIFSTRIEHKGRHLGRDCTIFVLSGKKSWCYGDAGAVLTENLELLKRMTKFARHGGLVKGEHEIEGINSRLDGMQAAILSVKLKNLKDWTKKRRNLAAYYNEALKGCNELVVPKEVHGCNSAWHLYVIKTSGLPSLPCYEYLGHHKSDFPVANELAETCLSLPLFPEMEAREQEYVVQHIYKYFEQK